MTQGVVTIDLAEVKAGDGIRLRDKNGNEATGPVTFGTRGMTVQIFGMEILFARWSSGAGRTRTGRWIPQPELKIVGHQPAMF